MRYFTKELWSKLNDCDETVRSKAEEEWIQNDKLYQQKLEKIKGLLSQHFLKEYLKRGAFHDYIILGLNVTKRGRTYSCEMQLTNGEENVLVIMNGLKMMQVDVISFQYCILGKLAWGYSEFAITTENDICLSILCDIKNEMQFVFEGIKFIKQ